VSVTATGSVRGAGEAVVGCAGCGVGVAGVGADSDAAAHTVGAEGAVTVAIVDAGGAQGEVG